MSVRQAPGWWPSLVCWECDHCGYIGPTRDCYTANNVKALLTMDQVQHEAECRA